MTKTMSTVQAAATNAGALHVNTAGLAFAGSAGVILWVFVLLMWRFDPPEKPAFISRHHARIRLFFALTGTACLMQTKIGSWLQTAATTMDRWILHGTGWVVGVGVSGIGAIVTAYMLWRKFENRDADNQAHMLAAAVPPFLVTFPGAVGAFLATAIAWAASWSATGIHNLF